MYATLDGSGIVASGLISPPQNSVTELYTYLTHIKYHDYLNPAPLKPRACDVSAWADALRQSVALATLLEII